MLTTSSALLAGLASSLLCAAAPAPAPAPLIPRALFFGNPERTNPQLSPDGDQLAWLQPDDQGTLQLWVRPREAPDSAARKVTSEKGRGVRLYRWAFNGDLLFFKDLDGDESFRLYAVRLSDARVMRLSAVAGIRPGDFQLSPERPRKALVVRGRRRATSLFGPPQKQLFDPWLVDLRTGELSALDENPGDAVSWIADTQLGIRGRVRTRDDGGGWLEVREPGDKPRWRRLISWGLRDTVEPIALSTDGKVLYALGNRNADTVGLVAIELKTGKMRRLASTSGADVFDVDLDPKTRRVRAVAFNRSRIRWRALEKGLRAELAALSKVDSGDLVLLGGDLADRFRVVLFDRDTSSGRFYLWDREERRATLLFASRPALDRVELAAMKPVEIRARDGLKLPSYLTLPLRVETKGLPLVLLVHGGPWTRDLWGYDGLVQFLASRGWAVLQVNYRGSIGFGKRFKNAALGQFAGRMHDDLVDAVRWAVRGGIADPKRVAIMGDSYGGYATLVGLTFTSEVFACGVDLFGPSNLVSLVEGLPDYWGPLLAGTWHAFVGDPKDPKARADMEARSPLFKAAEIRAPLLIGQGANDPRVRPKESEQMVAAIEKNGGAVTYIVYPDEGHGFARPENRLDFYARVERFLAGCLGGRFEPLAEGGVPGSAPTVREVTAKPAR